MKTNKQYIYIVRRLRKRWWRGRRGKASFTKGRQLTEEEEEGGMKGEQSAGVGTPKLQYVEKGIKWRERKRGGRGGRKVRKKRKRKKKKKKEKEKEKEREKRRKKKKKKKKKKKERKYL